ncbi:MAG: ABC transporter ATP-binding protein [Chloroflexi bacterium]|nr:ABC transporter ATP-binding protein [Chloroflexota bacterium]
MSGIRVHRLQLRYPGNDKLAVNIDGLEVVPGEFMAVMGESGSGKTTLLRLIAGLEKPMSGDVYLGGEWMNETPVGRRPVQMIFQTLALWPHLRVMDAGNYSNLSFPLKIRRWTREQIVERVRGVSDRVGLDEKLFPRRPDELSGGERQRVALARAMVTETSTFLMDEPLSSLDPISRPKMRTEIRRLHDELGATTLYVTHSVGDATAMADRIAVMRDGVIIQVGTYKHLVDNPVDIYVRELLTSY